MEAERHLAQLRERAHRLAEGLRHIATLLERTNTGMNRQIRDNPSYLPTYLSANEIRSVMDELEQAEQRVAELAQRKAALGLK